jgi:transposase
MEKILERCAALDVHKRQVTACARVPDRKGKRAELRAEFETMTPDLLALRDWLKGLGVTHVAMEATGVYWKPVYYLLEDDFELLLVNAQHVKNVPGRKTDVADAQWLCQLLEHGLLRASFVPPKPIRELRDLTRYRKSLIGERQREANRLQKLLEDANIKLASVATRTLGASGRAMLAELCEGRNDPEALAELARGKLRKKIPELRRALEGRFSPHHALIVSRLLAHVDYLDETIAELSTEIEGRLRPFEREVELLCTIPGVAQRTAEVILAELGPDMSRFPDHRHAASWAAICPGNDESAGKRKTGKTRKGDRWLRTALIEAANSAAGRTRNTYLNAQYVRIKRRRGHSKAIVAVAHSILVSAYHVLRDGVPYDDLGGDYFLNRERPERLTRHLVRQLERLGQRVTLEPVAEGAR